MFIITIEDIDIEFNKSLLYIWIELKQLIKDNENSKIDLSQVFIRIKMRKIADKFYKNFKGSEIPVRKLGYLYDSYNSVGIMFQDGSGFAIPYFFYQQLRLKNPPDYSEIFDKNLTWLDTLSEIYEQTFSVKSELNQTDVKILRALTYYKRNALFNDFDLDDQKVFNFHLKTLSEIINTSYRWTISRINYLYDNYIVQPSFILNPFIFGLKTILVQYSSQFEDDFSYMNPITLFKLNMNINDVIRIIQLPNIQSSTDLSFPETTQIINLKEMHIFNNLSDLSEDSNQSFKVIPKFEIDKASLTRPIIEFKDSMTVKSSYVLNEEDKEFYPLLTKMSSERRISMIVRILDYLARWRSVQGSLKEASKQLRATSAEFLETCKYLFNKDIIGYFPRISRVGCNNRYGILVKDKTGQESDGLLKIYNNLLELPHSVIFLGESILFGYVVLPDNYMSSFLRYLSSLHTKYEIKYNAFVALKSWGRFSIPLPEGTTVDEFGVNFPYDVMEKLKVKA